MILVIGGLGAGKREYIKDALGLGEEDIAQSALDEKPALAGLEELVWERGGWDEELLAILLEKKAVLCREVGSGVVPASPEERKWRDDVGKLCARLGREAERVVRVCCGIPIVMKGGGQ